MKSVPASLIRSAWTALGVALVAACGGSGGGSGPPPAAPFEESATLTEIGAAPAAGAVLKTVCAGALDPAILGPAAAVRYPRSTGVFRGWPSLSTTTPADYDRPLQLRSDRAGGFIVAHATDATGAMFGIGADGAKSALPLPYATVFDVAADGRIWFAADNALSVGTRDGAARALAALADGRPTADGPLGSAPVGAVRLIAAGRDVVYLLVEDGRIDLGTQPPTSTITRSLRMLARTAPGQDAWTLRTVPLPADLGALDIVSAMRAGPADALLLLINQPFTQLVSQQTVWPGALQSSYSGTASVRVMDASAHWRTLAATPFTLTVVPAATHADLGYGWSLDARDLSVSPSGTVWVGGAGALYTVDAARGWTRVASPAGLPTDAVGQAGAADAAAFASAVQLVADDAGVSFYDGETCQIRRLQDQRLSILSGPTPATLSFAGAGFLGQDQAGDLLVAYGAGASTGADAPYGRYTALDGLASARIADPGFSPVKIRSLTTTVDAPTCTTGSSYWASTGCTGAPPASAPRPGYWLGQGRTGPVGRIGRSFYADLASGAGRELGSTTSWPGVLDGDAPSGPSGVHLSGDTLYQFGWVRTDPAVQFPLVYHALRLYQFELGNGAATEVTGGNPTALVRLRHTFDFSSLIPTAGGGPALVQRRSDRRFWLSNGKELWLLDLVTGLRRVAGLSTSGAAADGIGDAASFALISSLRVLPDDHLLVVDRGAHAIRVVSDDGSTRTVVGVLNRPVPAPGTAALPLPAGLDTPVDAWAVGRDVYITTATSIRLLRASRAL